MQHIETELKSTVFTFSTDAFEHVEVGMKGREGEYFVTGYISTDEVDVAREVVTPECMKSLVDQLNVGNFKLDLEHELFLKKDTTPSTAAGRIVEAKYVQEGGKHKVWVKAQLNKNYMLRDKEGTVVKTFQNLWGEIKSHMVDAFSIAYKPREIVKTVVNNTTITLLKSIDLLNVALTGNPVNRGARMTESFMKSIEALEIQQTAEVQPPMAEQETTAPAPAAAPQEPSFEAHLKSIAAANEAALKDIKETFSTEFAGLKSLVEKQAETIAAQDAQLVELKALLEKPVLKAMAPTPAQEIPEQKQEQVKQPLDTIH